MREEKRSADFWLQLVDEFESSGITQPLFAQKKGVKLSTFRKWLYSLRHQHSKKELEFIEVKSAVSSLAPAFSMFLPNEVRIEFAHCPDVHFVADLVRALSPS